MFLGSGDTHVDGGHGAQRLARFSGVKPGIWFAWKENLKAKLQSLKLRLFLEAEKPSSSDPKYRVLDTDNEEAENVKCAALVAAIDTWEKAQIELYYLLVTHTDGAAAQLVMQHREKGTAAWKALVARYEYGGEFRKQLLRSEVHGATLTPGEPPSELFLRMNDAQRQLRDMGEEMPDHMLLGKVLDLFGKSTDQFYQGLMQGLVREQCRGNLTWDNLQTEVIAVHHSTVGSKGAGGTSGSGKKGTAMMAKTSV
jgi:hypothetical protein